MDTPLLTPQVVLTLAITLVALGLFVWGRLRADVVALSVMAALIVLGLVTPQEGISGFANEATVTVGLMLVLAAALVRTGVIDLMGRWIKRVAGRSEIRFLVIVLGFVVLASAFVNNTPVVIIMMPIALAFARDSGTPVSRLLLPISFASQLGGTLTLIGTSTNLLVAGLILELGLGRIHLFDITPPAAVLVVVGLAYLLTIGRWLAPDRPTEGGVARRYELRAYLTGLRVPRTSRLVGRSLREVRFEQVFGLQVIAIERDGKRHTFPRADDRLQEDDVLLAEGPLANVARIGQGGDLEIAHGTPELARGELEEAGVAEIMVPPNSAFVGRTIRELGLRAQYEMSVLGLRRHGEVLHEALADIALEAADLLLVQARPETLARLKDDQQLALLGAVDLPLRRLRKARVAVPIMAAVVLLPAFGITTILVSALLGALAMIVTGCIRSEEAYRDIDWMVVVLLGAIIPLGIAMRNTGTAELLASGVLTLTQPLGLYGTLAAFYLLTSLITEVISNNAAAVVLTPIAVATATSLEASPLPFVVAVMFAASNCFLTPIGYQTNMFIFGPGGYRFSDYGRVGAPLAVLMVIAATLAIPVFFPF